MRSKIDPISVQNITTIHFTHFHSPIQQQIVVFYQEHFSMRFKNTPCVYTICRANLVLSQFFPQKISTFLWIAIFPQPTKVVLFELVVINLIIYFLVNLKWQSFKRVIFLNYPLNDQPKKMRRHIRFFYQR